MKLTVEFVIDPRDSDPAKLAAAFPGYLAAALELPQSPEDGTAYTVTSAEVVGEQHIVITGNPVDGFVYLGPHTDRDEAVEAGDSLDVGDWWIATLRAELP